jgi:hypothetical protein
MGVIFAVAAFAIDAASWMQRHHQTQVVADSAALAAANCLANPSTASSSIVIGGTRTTVPGCSSGTDTTAAATVAEDYAQANGVSITPSQISFDTGSGHVNINATATSGGFFASLFGLGTTTQSAGAQARWTAGTSSNVCSGAAQAANQCYVIYATDTTCPTSANTSDGAVLDAGSETIDGAVHSNGNLFLDPGGSTYNSLTYGTGSGCGAYTYSGLNNSYNGSNAWGNSGGTFKSGDPTAATGSSTLPVPYGTSTNPFPTCTSSTSISSSMSLTPASNAVYCYTNTSSSAVTVTIGAAGSGDTFICTSATGAGACSLSVSGGGMTFTANNYPTNKLLMYATGSISMGGGNITFTGDLDAPKGAITVNSGSNVNTGLLEGYDVIFGGGSNTITGDGPTAGSGSSTPSGSDALTQ